MAAAPSAPPPASSVAQALPILESAAERAPHPAEATPAELPPNDRPWYRREPWLVWLLAANVPMAGALATPTGAAAGSVPLRLAGVALSALCVLVAVALLLRQGPFHAAHGRRGVNARPGRV